MRHNAPTDPAERVAVIDAVRGVALLGVLAANLRDYSLFDFLPAAAQAALPTARFDAVLEVAFEALVNARFLTIFSLLFGVGFAMQLQRAQELGDGMGRYVRRLVILLMI